MDPKIPFPTPQADSSPSSAGQPECTAPGCCFAPSRREFFQVAGLAGAAVHIVYATHFGSGAGVPTIGASGAISGVMGAYLIFFPRTQIKFMIWLIIFVRFFTAFSLMLLLCCWPAAAQLVGDQGPPATQVASSNPQVPTQVHAGKKVIVRAATFFF